MRHTFVFVVILVQSSFAFAQLGETISSGRPGQAIAPLTPGKGVFQIETGFDFSGATLKGDISGTETELFSSQTMSNSTLLRFGLAEKFELHAALSFRDDDINLPLSDTSYALSGLSSFAVGWRYNIWEGKDKQPTIAMMFSIKLNAVDSVYKNGDAAPQFILASTNPLSFADLTINLGADWDGITHEPTGLYIINLARGISDKVGVFIEGYGSFNADASDIRFDAGASLLLNNDMQLDILGGYGDNDGYSDYFMSVGFSWRIAKSREEIPTE